MNDQAARTWQEANQQALLAALAGVRGALERHAGRAGGSGSPLPEPRLPVPDGRSSGSGIATRDATSADDADAPAIEQLCATFGLTPFERDVLLLCAGVELDAAFGPLCAAAQGDPARPYPTFGLALAALPEAHWSALTPDAPLRRWRLVEVTGGGALTASPLRIDERVLHYLAGVTHLDERLSGLVFRVAPAAALVPSQQAVAERLVALWSQEPSGRPLPVVQLCGDDATGKRAVAAYACTALGLALSTMPADAVPAAPADGEALLRAWEREAALSASALLLDCDEQDLADATRSPAAGRLIERMASPLIVSSREPQPARQRLVVTLDVRKPTIHEQRDVWQRALGAAARPLNGQVDRLVSQFSLSAPRIHSAAAEALRAAHPDATAGIADRLWDACRRQARPRLDELAQHLDPSAAWDDLILPETQRQVLQEIALHVRQRAKVYETWGFARRGSRGLGISALFAGASGTGKTMAAEVLAGELRLDLYRIDLSQVVSKYIGETEKNLRRVFDAADEGGAILLFDEADALFGKRTEVRDSHDRYANIEVSYLLQRMEAYRGLAILTTNMKSALDPAFLRRIRFVVQFPFPDAAQRAAIWQRIFPPQTPTDGLDVAQLARLNLAGGNIRNIALQAAFLAADADEPVGMAHLLRAARSEYAKLEKPLTGVETGGWA